MPFWGSETFVPLVEPSHYVKTDLKRRIAEQGCIYRDAQPMWAEGPTIAELRQKNYCQPKVTPEQQAIKDAFAQLNEPSIPFPTFTYKFD